MERIQFDYQKYLQGGYIVKTRDGEEVSNLNQSWTGYSGYCNGRWEHWGKDGKYYSRAESTLDLFLHPISDKEGEEKKWSREEVIKIIHGWDMHINIHEEDKGNIHTMKEYLTSLTNPK